MKLPVFSVIVPVYKVENYLDRCVQSIINQTYSNIEVILVDDGSPDNCPAMCDEYAKKDKRIKVIHKENSGPSAARNAALDIATGEYVLFVDSDDHIESDTCEKLLPFVEKGYDIIAGNGVAKGAFKKLMQMPDPKKDYSGSDYLKIALERGSMPMVVWLYAYKRVFLQQHHLSFRKDVIHEDEHFIPRVFLLAERVVSADINFYHYVIRENSITTNKNLSRNLLDLYEVCLDLKKIYSALEDKYLAKLLVDSLVVKYLSLFQNAKGYKFGRDYIHKDFVWHNAKRVKTRLKALLFCVSPVVYCLVNHLEKSLNQ